MFEFGANDVRAVSGNLSEDIAYEPVSEEIANKILQDFSEKMKIAQCEYLLMNCQMRL